MSRKQTALNYFEMYKDAVDARVNGGIEFNRKGDATVKVKHADGSKVTDFVIEVKQKNHEFKHGANIFLLGEFKDEQKESVYRQKFAEAFNLATLPFYWNTLEPVEGEHRYLENSPEIYRRPPIERCMRYCKEMGIEPKAHCLNYEHFAPEWVKDLTVEEYKKKLDKRFRELSEKYADRISSWEVTNETFKDLSNCNYTQFYLEDDFVEWSFDTAEKYFSNNHLIINDYYIWNRGVHNNRDPYFMQIDRLLRHGAHLDSVGVQFHSFFPREDEEKMAAERYNPMVLFKLLDNYAKLGKRIQLTEMTIPCYSVSEEDEYVQAELVKNIYRVFFSHPAMEAIIYWNLVDGYAYSKTKEGRDSIGEFADGENQYRGGLLRFDMTEKPAFTAIKDMFNKEWHTETVARSNNSVATFRGFYGDYDITVHADGQTVQKSLKLSRDNLNNFEIII